jgi:hypothetical protein
MVMSVSYLRREKMRMQVNLLILRHSVQSRDLLAGWQTLFYFEAADDMKERGEEGSHIRYFCTTEAFPTVELHGGCLTQKHLRCATIRTLLA